ncbi:MAG: SIR2 family protein, partial [Candidatus Omnitrophica bacterium]|nr:SIR2 family protein [Candidatus Omnitrophota bacterium]
NNSWIHRKPCCVERLMITPGMVKHKHINDNRNELFGRYDAAVNNHSAFLFIGFGFNDTQIVNTKLLYKLKDQQCHGLIITRDSNDRIEKILKDCKNLWLICKNQKENNNGTRIFNSCFKDWLYVDEQIWDCKVFTKQILGG